MRPPIVPKFGRPQRRGPSGQSRVHSERGITLLLVAVAMLAIIGMAALAIDVVTLYLAREEAQRAADAGAIAGARVLAMSGVTGDPDNANTTGTLNVAPWPAACSVAQQVATDVANQNAVNSALGSPTVTFLYNGASVGGCDIGANQKFGVNPQVQVQVKRNGLPSLFSRIWSKATNTITATATAEAFNPSESLARGITADIVPVAPRCVKPWIIPNLDANGSPIVRLTDGSIQNRGILTGSLTGSPIIGQSFQLQVSSACTPADCTLVGGTTPNKGDYVAALVSATPAVAIPGCANGTSLQQAIGGCDDTTAYYCGAAGASFRPQLDYTINPTIDTDTALNCLISSGDTMDYSVFPFQIKAGPSNPLVTLANPPILTGQPISSSTSVVSLPIFDNTGGWPGGSSQPTVEIVGFLQVFIDSLPSGGRISTHILNVVGCGNGTSNPVGPAVYGSSPVPVRLITPSPP